MTGKGVLVGIREYARWRSERGRLGEPGFDSCSPAAVRRAIEDGRISAAVVGSGRARQLNRDEADRLWAANTLPSQQRARLSHPGATSPIPASRDAAKREAPAREVTPLTMAEANLRLIKWRARRERIEYLREIGKLVDATVARDATFELARRLRERLLELPRRLSDELASESDWRRIQQILERELRDAINGALRASEIVIEVPPAAPDVAEPTVKQQLKVRPARARPKQSREEKRDAQA